MNYLRSALSCFGLGGVGEVCVPVIRNKEHEEQGCGRCRSYNSRLTDTERNIDKLWSAAHTLRNRLDQCDTDLEMILHWFNRVTYSPTYISEEPDTISGVIVGDASGHDNQNESFNSRIPTVIESSTSIINLSHQENYKMNHVKRAKCIIFSHEMFTYKKLETRTYADEEAQLVKRTFQNLGFEVFIYKDYTHEQIKILLTKLSTEDYTEDDCICIFVLTHGEANGLVWALDVCYSIDIFEETLSNIEALAEKPKLIFVQLLSNRMAEAIRIVGRDTSASINTSNTWRNSANFCQVMKAVMDGCNSYSLKTNKIIKQLLSSKNQGIEDLLTKVIPWCANFTMLHNGKRLTPPCFNRIPLTLTSIIGMYKDIQSTYPDFELANTLCNQYSVEHAFSQLRARGGFNANPTSRMVRLNLRHYLSIQNIAISKLVNFIRMINEEEKRSDVKITRRDLSTNLSHKTDSNELKEYNEVKNATIIAEINVNIDPQFSSNITEFFEDNANTFFAGYLARKSVERSKCNDCKFKLTKNTDEPLQSNEEYSNCRDYSHSSSTNSESLILTRPTKEYTKIVKFQLKLFHYYFHSNRQQLGLVSLLISEIQKRTKEKFPFWFNENHSCYIHR